MSNRLPSLQASIRRYMEQGDLSSARQKLAELQQAGGDTAALSSEIEKAQQEQVRLQQYEANYREIVQKYRDAASANDQRGLEAARDALQSVAQGGGARAADARADLSEVNSKLAALSQPVAPPPPPTVTKPVTPSPRALDEAAIRTVIRRYEQAFDARDADALRVIWPTIGSKMYGGYKDSFAAASALQMHVQFEKVDISQDGEKATLNAVLSQDYTPKGSKKGNPRQDRAVFELTKSNGNWVISDVR